MRKSAPVLFGNVDLRRKKKVKTGETDSDEDKAPKVRKSFAKGGVNVLVERIAR